MDNQIFRQKNMDQISSTDELHDYLRVTSPKLWMILSVILALIVGFIIFACTVTMENTLDVTVFINHELAVDDDGQTFMIEIPEKYSQVVKPDMLVRVADYVGYITTLFIDNELTQCLGVLFTDVKLPDGRYDAEIVLEVSSPIRFLLN